MRILCIASLLLALSGCAGTNFTFDQARQVKVGMTEEQVTGLMGRPYSVVTIGDTQRWIWSHANGMTGSARTVSFDLKDGKVSAVPAIPGSLDGSKTAMTISTPAAPVTAAPPADRPLTKEEYKQVQIQQLMQQNLPYDEYQKRYKAITEQ